MLKSGIGLLGGLFHNAGVTIAFHLFIIFVSIIIAQLTGFFPRKFFTKIIKNTKLIGNLIYNLELSSKTKEQYKIIEYPLIMLFVITGAIFLISCNDIISIFLSIELQSYGLYLLCALYRDSESSVGASLIYFLLGGLSSCFILIAFAILYGNSGISALNNYYLFVSFSDIRNIMPNIVY
jgi:NADH-ubiquinone oxidoreductase chain 2